jgi:CheY-specific phosphatase CheX
LDQTKFDFYVHCIQRAFTHISHKMTGIAFQESSQPIPIGNGENTVAVILGVCGPNKGRIMFTAGRNIAKNMGDKVNGEDCANILDLYLSLGEFANTFAGSAISDINNEYRGTNLRLTPPAVFGGEEMAITTPNIHSTTIYFQSKSGPILLDIGFEGV